MYQTYRPNVHYLPAVVSTSPQEAGDEETPSSGKLLVCLALSRARPRSKSRQRTSIASLIRRPVSKRKSKDSRDSSGNASSATPAGYQLTRTAASFAYLR